MAFLPEHQNRLIPLIKTKQKWNDVSKLCKERPDLLNTYDEYDTTPLLRAMWNFAPEKCVLSMLENANKETVDKREKRADLSILFELVESVYQEALEYTLAISNKNVNAKEKLYGFTPLHWCLESEKRTYEQHLKTANILLKHGAMISIKDKRGMTPIEYYENNKCIEYDQKEREEQKATLLKILQGEFVGKTPSINKGKMIPVEILARGPAALNAFVEALKEGQMEVKQGRTIVMGLERVGKTSTIKSFFKKKFNPDEPITDAIATNKTYIHNSPDDWNEAKQDKSPVTVIYEEKVAESIAIKVSKDSQETEQKEAEDISEIQDNPHQPSTSAESLKQVPESIANRAEEKIRYASKEISKWKTPTNEFIMEIWDFGGQPIYNVIQRIFIPSFSVVCVIFNLEHDLDKPAMVRDPTTNKLYEHRMTYLDYILYWIRSAYINCRHFELDGILGPPVLLIGTHCNSISASEAEKKFEKIRNALKDKPYEKMVCSTDFKIENSVPFTESNAALIMDKILQFAKKIVEDLRVPLKWLLVQQEIQQLKKKYICVETTKIMELLELCGVRKNQDVLLRYLHDIGVILYYPNDRSLKDIIVVNLLQLVDLSKSIITVIEPQFQEPSWKPSWRKLDSGVLEYNLLRHLWDKFHFSNEEFDFFVNLLQHFGLLCKKKLTEVQNRVFYVLSRLKPIQSSFPTDSNYGNRAISLYHDFDNYLPDDVFQRTVTKFIETFQMADYEPKLNFEHVELDIDEDHHVILSVATINYRRMFKTTIIRRKLNQDLSNEELEPSVCNQEPEPSVCKKVLEFSKAELKIFCPNSGQGVIDMRTYVPCICCTNPHWHIIRSFDKKVLPCDAEGMDFTRYRRLFGDEIPMPHKGCGASWLSNRTEIPSKLADLVKSSDTRKRMYEDFCLKLSDVYEGKRYKLLRFLLYDFLPINVLSRQSNNGIDLFNELHEKRLISSTNVTILSEVAYVTDLVSAQECVDDYKQANECKEGRGLMPLRKGLFKGLIQVPDDDVPRLTAGYNLSHFDFDNVWDLVFHLENEEKLEMEDLETWKRFANRLNNRAKRIITNALNMQTTPEET